MTDAREYYGGTHTLRLPASVVMRGFDAPEAETAAAAAKAAVARRQTREGIAATGTRDRN